MSPTAARKTLHDLGARTMDCRGFYSHFLRVWYPADAERSLTTIDFTNAGGLPKRKVERLVARITSMKSRSTK